MPRTPNQSGKLLYILKILWQETDPEHKMTVPQLIETLEQNGINAERKSIYSYLKLLEEEFDFDILQPQKDRKGCALASRNFELPEVSMLMDMVQSSRFLTQEKAEQLLQKLSGQVSRHQAERIRRQIYRTGASAKGENERIYYTLDQINEAMNNNHQLSYQYWDWSLTQGRRARHGGERYCVSPWALIFQDENYYLVAYESKSDRIKHYRVDRIQQACEEADKLRVGKEQFEQAHPATYAKRMFGMYGGQEARVTLRCKANVLNAVKDRFGADISVVPDFSQEFFTVQVLVSVSPQFYAWVFGFGQDMEIVHPVEVRKEYKTQLEQTLGKYLKKEL